MNYKAGNTADTPGHNALEIASDIWVKPIAIS